MGVGLGLVVGKILVVTLGALTAVRLRVGVLLAARPHLGPHRGLAGIGFTVPLFITDLAFTDAGPQAASKIGILVASFVASVIGASLTFVARPNPETS